MKKKKDLKPIEASGQDMMDEAKNFIKKKKIQNKVLKELIQKLQETSGGIFENSK